MWPYIPRSVVHVSSSRDKLKLCNSSGVFPPQSRRWSFWRDSSSWSLPAGLMQHISSVRLHLQLQQLFTYRSYTSPAKLTSLNATLDKGTARLLGTQNACWSALVCGVHRNTPASGWERLTWTRTACLCWPLKKTSSTREHPPTGTVKVNLLVVSRFLASCLLRLYFWASRAQATF